MIVFIKNVNEIIGHGDPTHVTFMHIAFSVSLITGMFCLEWTSHFVCFWTVIFMWTIPSLNVIILEWGLFPLSQLEKKYFPSSNLKPCIFRVVCCLLTKSTHTNRRLFVFYTDIFHRAPYATYFTEHHEILQKN